MVAVAMPSSTKLEAIRIVTRCTSRAQFVTMFRRFCNPTSCFIPSRDLRPAGLLTAFSIRLADGTAMLRGEGVVLEAWRTADNPFGRPGVHLGIHQLSEDSTVLYEQLLVPATTRTHLPVAGQLALLDQTTPVATAELETPTVEMSPLELPDAPRRPGSPLVLPANPLAELSEDGIAELVDCQLGAESDAVPVPAEHEATIRTRDPIATLLGIVPLAPPKIYAAPTLVPTELIDRIAIEHVEATPSRAEHLLTWCVAATLAAATLMIAMMMMLS